MALDAGNNIINTNTGLVVAGKDVGGGYFVVDSLSSIPNYSKITGALCYVTGTTTAPINKFYQYNGTEWAEAKLGGGGSGSGLLVCNTAASSSNKVIQIDDFELKNGQYLIYFSAGSFYQGKITLNIGNTGAKDIYINHEKSSSTNYTLAPGTYIVTYSDDSLVGGYYIETNSTAALSSAANTVTIGTEQEISGEKTFSSGKICIGSSGGYGSGEIEMGIDGANKGTILCTNSNREITLQTLWGAGSSYSPSSPTTLVLRSESKVYYVKNRTSTPTDDNEIATKADIEAAITTALNTAV